MGSAPRLQPKPKAQRHRAARIEVRAPAAAPAQPEVVPAPLTAAEPSEVAVPQAAPPARAVHERPEQFAPAAIADEVSLLGAAHKELHAGQPTRALGYIRQHAFRFPTGALAQERAAVHALALCALNRKTAAREVFEDLQRRAPSAAVLTRIRRDCGF
jgi:hypothetical protein